MISISKVFSIFFAKMCNCGVKVTAGLYNGYVDDTLYVIRLRSFRIKRKHYMSDICDLKKLLEAKAQPMQCKTSSVIPK